MKETTINLGGKNRKVRFGTYEVAQFEEAADVSIGAIGAMAGEDPSNFRLGWMLKLIQAGLQEEATLREVSNWMDRAAENGRFEEVAKKVVDAFLESSLAGADEDEEDEEGNG